MIYMYIYIFSMFVIISDKNTMNLLEFLSIVCLQIISDIGEQATIYCPLYICIFSFDMLLWCWIGS